MKRALNALQRDEREHQEDALLRAQLQREEASEAAQRREKVKEENYSKKWREHLDKWDEHGLKAASDRELHLPVPDPPGPQSPPLRSVLAAIDQLY